MQLLLATTAVFVGEVLAVEGLVRAASSVAHSNPWQVLNVVVITAIGTWSIHHLALKILDILSRKR